MDPDLVNLLQGILEKTPEKRFTMKQIKVITRIILFLGTHMGNRSWEVSFT